MKQQSEAIAHKQNEGFDKASQNAQPEKKRPSIRRNGMVNFKHWEREAQLEAFFVWLPEELHDAPGIDWSQLSPEIMGYCMRTIRNGPDATTLAVVAASVLGSVDRETQLRLMTNVHILLRSLRTTCKVEHLIDLRQEAIWNQWMTFQKKTTGTRLRLDCYASISTGHFPRYLLRLDLPDRQRMQKYALPSLPCDFRERHFPARQIKKAQEMKRKSTTDILVPLYPVLRQIIRFRKQLAERTLMTIREASRRIMDGEAVLPYSFEHTDMLPEVNRDAKTVATASIQGRQVTLPFVLWDKRTWVLHHQDRYERHIISHARWSKHSYTQERNCLFVEYTGNTMDLLWFGDLVGKRLLKSFRKESLFLEATPEQRKDYQDRWQYAKRSGFPTGCITQRRGLLTTGDNWFSETMERGSEIIFDFESVYRGILYGAAIAMIALSNGSRMSELLQVSWNKERRIVRTEEVVLLGKDGQPQLGENGKPLTKQVKLHFQHLLPKGGKTEEERQLFPLSKEALRLLGEIKILLEETYGEIPTIMPARTNKKREHLKPERYLFQWSPSEGGITGALNVTDVCSLLRFILHGLDLYTAQGEPIRVSIHVIRHVMATHARYHRNVPPEAIAHFFLHHRLKGQIPVLANVSEYYTLMTEEQRLALISMDLDEQEEMDHALLQAATTSHDLEQMNENLREVYEVWNALHPTALGYCGCPGLCPRGNDRALCLGCSYLATDPERIGAALSWQASYAQQADLFEAQGNTIDARQARIKVQQLDDMINVMRLQIQAEVDGSYIPLSKVLPSPYRQRDEPHGEKN